LKSECPGCKVLYTGLGRAFCNPILEKKKEIVTLETEKVTSDRKIDPSDRKIDLLTEKDRNPRKVTLESEKTGSQNARCSPV